MNDIKDMKRFYWKLLLGQTVLYGLFYLMCYTDSLTKTGELMWTPLILTFYVASVIITFIIPMIKLYRNEKN
jgi:hypothetical protein